MHEMDTIHEEGNVYSIDKFIEMLSSKNASTRYAACEWIRAIEESSPEIVTALEKATHDEDKEVAERAKLALQEEGVHRQMALKMGFTEPHEIQIGNTQLQWPIKPESQKNQTENQDQSSDSWDLLYDDQFVYLQACQAVTFIIIFFSIIYLGLSGSDVYKIGVWSWILIGIYLIYIGMQVYSIIKFGFRNSFYFLKVLLKLFVRY
jgi:hypothetical protein